MATTRGKTVTPKAAVPKASSNTNLDNIKLDPATLAYLNSAFGSEAAWVSDPQLGPLILQIAKNGLTDPARIKDYLQTHAVDASGKIQVVAPDQSWYGTKGSAVRNALIQQKTDIGTYNANVEIGRAHV